MASMIIILSEAFPYEYHEEGYTLLIHDQTQQELLEVHLPFLGTPKVMSIASSSSLS